MEFYTVPCPGRGKVKLDGGFQGENIRDNMLHVFQCGEGTHYISMECLVAGKECKKQVQRVSLIGTNLILAQEVPFICAQGVELRREPYS